MLTSPGARDGIRYDFPGRNMLIDLRTDFVSTPTEEMIEAMARAARQPPSFGLRDDPIVAELEALAAQTLGKEDTLFCATCAAANQIAIHLHCRPGEAIVAEAGAHIITSEAGAHAALSGTVIHPLSAHPAVPRPGEVESAFSPAVPQRSRSALLWLENTHVGSGGTVLSREFMHEMILCARQGGAHAHLDGSRIFNAAAALGASAAEVGREFDSVAASLNKGLGAPMGAVLAGSRAFIGQATRVRQMFGGGWRPAHIPAAAAIVALRTMVDRIADDHARARELAAGLRGIEGLQVDLGQVQTNIVFVGLKSTFQAPALVELLRQRGVLAMQLAPDRLRLVLWHGIGRLQVDRTVEAFRDALHHALTATAAAPQRTHPIHK